MSRTATKKGRWLLGLLGLVAALLVSMAISYGLVRLLTQQYRIEQRPDYASILNGRLLRAYGNELGELVDHLVRDAMTGKDASAKADAYLREVFRPRLQQLRSRIQTQAPTNLELFRNLLLAADRALFMSVHGKDLQLREMTFRQIEEAILAAEQFISRKGLNNYIEEQPRPHRFFAGPSGNP